MRVPAVIADAHVVATRNIIKIKRVPDLLVFTVLSPIMFVLLFAYVFGGAIGGTVGPGGDSGAYREYLIAGIFAQTVIFGATITGAGLHIRGSSGRSRTSAPRTRRRSPPPRSPRIPAPRSAT